LLDGRILMDVKEKILAVNQLTHNLLGYSEIELVGKQVDLLFGDKEFSRKSLENLVEKRELKHYETEYKTKTGDEIPVSILSH